MENIMVKISFNNSVIDRIYEISLIDLIEKIKNKKLIYEFLFELVKYFEIETNYKNKTINILMIDMKTKIQIDSELYLNNIGNLFDIGINAFLMLIKQMFSFIEKQKEKQKVKENV